MLFENGVTASEHFNSLAINWTCSGGFEPEYN